MLALNQATCEHPPIHWTAIELSKIAASILPHIFPGADINAMSFEEWLHRTTTRGRVRKGIELAARDQGKIRLVVSNPALWPPRPHREVGTRRPSTPRTRRLRTSSAAGSTSWHRWGIGVF